MEKGRETLRLSAPQSKLLPRDLSQSLGKLPPQALDMEIVVLGAVMLEKSALAKIPFLKASHFYSDTHVHIFSAIKQIEAEGIHPDTRLVRARLSANGHLELIGGAFALAELTSQVSSTDNIEHHAREIVEVSMKRDLIQIASKIHNQAYDDTTDVFELLERTQEDTRFLKERETQNSGPEKIKELWEKFRITNKPERPETLIKLGDADVCTVGNVSLLVGKKKSRKSLLVTHLLHIFLKSRDNLAADIIVFDTEQEEFDVWQAKDRLYRMTNQHVPFFCLRGLAPRERREFIEQTILHWPGRKPKIGVIDGIRDCMSNINDPDESTEVVSWLMRLNVEYRIHFINILHLNKTDNNARGHIGTELLNKAEVTIEVELDNKTGYSVVKCESSRRKPFEPFIFTHSATGLPELMGVPVGHDTVNQAEEVKRLQAVFEGETLKHKDLKEAIMSHFAIGDSRAKQMIAKIVARGWVIKSGPDRSPNTTYKLMVSPGTYTPPPVVQENPQMSLSIDTTPEHLSSDILPF